MRIIQISDTHLSAQGGVTAANFERLVRWVNDVVAPDLVVNTGDVVLADPDRTEDRTAACERHALIRAPWRVLPGNHDVGEIGPDPWQGLSVTTGRVKPTVGPSGTTAGSRRWTAGPSSGCNSQLCASGLGAEEDQWDWMAGAAAGAAGQPTLLFLHKPLFWPLPGDGEPTLALPAQDRDRLLALFEPGQLRAVGSGHLHRFRRRQRGALTEVWAPSTAFLASDDGRHGLPPGLERLGVVEYRCQDGRVDARFRSVPDLVECDVTQVPEMAGVVAALEGRPPSNPTR